MTDLNAPSAMSTPDPRGVETRNAIIEVAIRLFGDKGYRSTTVRDLTSAAGVNLGAINYHFGSKDGLHHATIDYLASEFRVKGPGKSLSAMDLEALGKLDAEQARQLLRQVMRTSFELAVFDKNFDSRTRYIHRELLEGEDTIKLFFEKVFSVQFALMRGLVAKATGVPEDDPITAARTINVVAQSVFLNLARPLVLQAMGWEKYDQDSVDLMSDAFWLHHQ